MAGGNKNEKNEGKPEEKKKASGESQDPVLASIFSKINLLTVEANSRATTTDAILQTLSDKFDNFTEGITEVKSEIGNLKSEIIKEKRENRRHDTKLSELEKKLEFADRDSRRSNIVLEGIEENKDKSLIDILQDLLDDLQVSFGINDCDKIFRRGKRQTPREGFSPPPRPIVVVFVRLCYKVEVFKKIRNLTGIQKWDNVYLNDDFTQQQKIQIGELRSISALAKRNGMDSKVRGSSLLIDGRRYGYGDVDRLPNGLTIEAAKTFPVDGERGIGFQSKHSIFSNMSKCQIAYEGYDFNSAEEVYQYVKAKECGTRADVQSVLVADDAHKAKIAGNGVKESAAWHRKKVQVMKDILMLKVESDCGLKEKLIESGTKDLYELTHDKFWGCGFPPAKSDQIKQKGNPGANRLGKLLMEIRSTLTKQ